MILKFTTFNKYSYYQGHVDALVLAPLLLTSDKYACSIIGWLSNASSNFSVSIGGTRLRGAILVSALGQKGLNLLGATLESADVSGVGFLADFWMNFNNTFF